MGGLTAEVPAARPRLVYAACGASLVIGVIFVFVRAPHPWGWEGFDHYHELALGLAQGRGFPTMDYPWGYAFFLAAFYRAFGDHPWIPLTAQVVLNALTPILVFDLASTWLDRRTATLAALLTGLFSFNTVYASTQSSDAICTIVFMAALVAFAAARRRDRLAGYALVGLLTGIAPQFRPNLILVPGLLAAITVIERPSAPRLARAVLLVACAALAVAPWVIRNYRLTGSVLPTSVHGGVQLWYGTLQAGPYLNSRAYNPRSAFETPSFEYSSLLDVPLVVRADVNPCLPDRPSRTSMTFWTDRDPAPRTVDWRSSTEPFRAEWPAPKQPAVIYYFFESECPGEREARQTPAPGAQAPFVYFVSRDHLGDLDVHGDLLDVFDLVRLIRHDAWGEPLAFAPALAAAGVERAADAVEALTSIPASGPTTAPPPRLVHGEDRAALALADGSAIDVPRQWTGRITDVGFDGGAALALLHAKASLAELREARAAGGRLAGHARDEQSDVQINRVFYRLEPHLMHRYTALALDNIRRDPVAFAVASLYRALRLFVIVGTEDPHTAHQFDRSRVVYTAATVVSVVYLLLFVAGVVVAWRRGEAFWLPLVLVLYVPATLAPVLTNMRYTITVQPLIFMFIALALLSITSMTSTAADRPARDRGETRTARQL